MLNPGTRLGPYEILSSIGAGGMGEVYKARDTRLERTVAVKVLPPHLSDDLELKQRFEREARAISQLTHPHICTLYDVGSENGVEFLVMELLEGQTLAERIEKVPLPTDQVLRFGTEIADALDRAHRAGIIHRDLKPGNVMLTPSGVKLLDFGLARIAAAERRPGDLSSLPTQAAPSRPLTERGTVMGTFQYMAPEQLEGKDADARTDVFAFGCVLYEMATGKKAFQGASHASLVSAILRDEPRPISEVAPMAPPSFDRLVRTCLAKDPEERWQSCRDVKNELAWIAQAGSQAGAPATLVSRRKNREKLAWVLAAVAGAAALAGWYRIAAAPKPARRAVRLAFAKPDKAPFEFFESLTPSPDGSSVAFIAHTSDERRSLWIRPIDSLDARPLPGTEDARNPFWSPDSRYLAFFANGKLKKIPAAGGPAENLCDAADSWGGSWGSRGVIIFEGRDLDGVSRVPAEGGTPSKVTSLAPEEEAHRWPVFLPDGEHFLFLVDASKTEGHWIGLSSLSSGKVTRLAHAISNLAFSPTGHLLYVKSGSLVAQPFDTKALRFSGDPTPVGENPAEIGQNHRFDFGVSANGLLVYQSSDPNVQFVWFDRAGKRIGAAGEPGRTRLFNLSPDDQRVAFEKLDSDGRNANIWSLDLVRGFKARVTSDAASDFSPTWNPDGKTLYFMSTRKGMGDIFSTGSAGGGEDRLVLPMNNGSYCWSISPDSRSFIYETIGDATKSDLWILPLTGDRTPRPFRRTAAVETEAQFSPDGRFVAFTSDDSGRSEVYVASFSDLSEQWRVSSSGGQRPRWRGDGKELFFMAGSRLMSAGIALSPSFRAEVPRPLFSVKDWTDYAAAKDGQRFLISTNPSESDETRAVAVLNWTAAIKE